MAAAVEVAEEPGKVEAWVCPYCSITNHELHCVACGEALKTNGPVVNDPKPPGLAPSPSQESVRITCPSCLAPLPFAVAANGQHVCSNKVRTPPASKKVTVRVHGVVGSLGHGLKSVPDTYVRLTPTNGKGVVLGNEVTTPIQRSVANPYWGVCLELPLPPPSAKVEVQGVLVEVCQSVRLRGDTVLCRGEVALSALATGAIKDVALSTPSCKVQLERLDMSRTTRTVFFIRHAQSQWNEAQEAKNVRGMLHFDHPLSQDGVAQAQMLNAQWRCEALSIVDGGTMDDHGHFLEAFLSAEYVVCSPLTRALQTALVVLQTHPAAHEKGIFLHPGMRELKKMGGMDTVGIALGNEIVARALETLEDDLVQGEIDHLGKEVDARACQAVWWTGKADFDSAHQNLLDARFADVMASLRHAPGDGAVIAVGHSLFLQDLFRRYSGAEFVRRNPDLAKAMVTKKIPNAACFGVDIDFSGPRPQITHAQPMFGMTFV